MEGAEAALLLDRTQDKLAVLDGEGTFTYVNAAAERILGYEPERLVGEDAFGFVHPEDRPAVRSTFEAVVERDSYADATETYRHRAADGSWVWLESRMANLADDALEGYVVSSRPVTDRVEAERERAASEARLRELAETTDDVLWMFDADWAELLFVNAAYERVFGRSSTELEGDPTAFLDCVHPDDRALVEDAMARASAGQSVQVEYRVNPDEDYDRWVWVQAEPVVESGEVRRVVGFARDVTHRRRRERQMRVLDNLLRHNLRTKMNVILGNLSLIESELAGATDRAPVVRRAGEELIESAEKQRTILDLLQSPAASRELDLATVVGAAVDAVRESYPDAVVTTAVPDSLSVDALGEFGACVEELVENAVRHGGESDRVALGACRNHETATLVVRDEGDPIPEYDRRVLTGEHDMDAVYHSSGCGLWLVYWVVDLSGGDVDCRYDGGNVVEVTVPRA